MRAELAQLNDVDIVFNGRLEDQFGNAVSDAEIKFDIPFNNGQSVGTSRGAVTADENGFFSIAGYKGKSLSIIPVKAGYALASSNNGDIYSYMWPDAARTRTDMNARTVIKMWKLQGAEPLSIINSEYKVPLKQAPILFDLVSGQIVPYGGDFRITVNRPDGVISEQSPQPWSINVQPVDGGFIPTSVDEWRITYFAPDSGYIPSGTFTNNSGVSSLTQSLFMKSRGGQVYGKIRLSCNINELPEGQLEIKLTGVANTNASRNWEGDPNTVKAAGQ
jgi:hypothetical protein